MIAVALALVLSTVFVLIIVTHDRFGHKTTKTQLVDQNKNREELENVKICKNSAKCL